MAIHESFAFRPQPDELQTNAQQFHLDLSPDLEQRRNPGAVIEQTTEQVRRTVEQEARQAAREQQAALRAARERAEISATLVTNFDLIDGSNRTQRRDGKITRDEILNFRRDHATELTPNELSNLQKASREFPAQIGRGKDWANKADIETYKVSPPVVVRRPAPRREEEGIDDKIKDKAKGIWNGIRRRVGD